MTVFSNFGKYGIVGAGGGAGFEITGGNMLAPGDGYTYHVFLASNNSTTTTHSMDVSLAGASLNASAMVVGGGGPGGYSIGGGGGAGGVLFTNNKIVLADGAYVIVVGAGQAADFPGPGSAPPVSTSFNGANSNFYHPTTPVPTRALARGGGVGGSYGYTPVPTPALHTNHGLTGGSAGGTGGQHPTQFVGTQYTNGTQPAPSPIWTAYANRGGAGTGGSYSGGGGGGAGGAGVNGSGNRPGGNGGPGIAIPIFPGPGIGLSHIPSNKYAAGGSGTGYPNGGTAPSIDGIGGRGGHAGSYPTMASAGTPPTGYLPASTPRPTPPSLNLPAPVYNAPPFKFPNRAMQDTGSGGGASGYGGLGGAGASGIVVVRYLTQA